jgi:acetyl-CoA carboxylase beta subunit
VRLNARELIELVLDDGSWVSWDRTPARKGAGPAYLAELAEAERRSGADGGGGWRCW